MKKLFFAAVAIVSLASCVKNEVIRPEVNDEITYQTLTGPVVTKGLVNSAADMAGDAKSTFGTFAVYKPKADAAEGFYIGEANGAVEICKTADNDWRAKDVDSDYENNGIKYYPYYWPKAGTLKFYSYYPFDATVNATFDLSAGLKITGYTVDQAIDLMVAAEATREVTAINNPKVTTSFYHILTQVAGFKFKLQNQEIEDQKHSFKVTKIEFVNLYNTGDYAMPRNVSDPTGNATTADYWTEKGSKVAKTPFGSTHAIMVNDATNVASTDEGLYLLAIPQVFGADAKIVITYDYYYNNSEVITNLTGEYALNTKEWRPNKKITYNVTFGLDEIIWDNPNVESWTSESIADTPIVHQ